MHIPTKTDWPSPQLHALASMGALLVVAMWSRAGAAAGFSDTEPATLPVTPVPPPSDDSPSLAPAKGAGPVAASAPLFAPTRREFIVVPDLGGNSDIGVEVGASLQMAGFRPGYTPYAWRLVALVSVSFKDDSQGFRLVQQYYGAHLDLPQFLSPKVRLDLRANFLRAVDSWWFGIGNRTARDLAPAPNGTASANEYTSESVRLRALVRVKTGTPVDFAAATNLRYEFPTVYPGSQIASDVAAGYVVGSRPAFLATVAEGFILDTRDNEFAPHHGVYYQVGVGETVGTAESVSFGEVSAVLSHYVPLGPKVVFANRLIASYKWGHVPFYELQTAGAFDPFILIGGERGLRGIPSGRYAGPLKALTNNELRVTAIPRFRVLRWSLQIGFDVFFDAGRVFSEFADRAGVDGTGLGIKTSTGGGCFFRWDESSVFRFDAAYSPSGAGGPPVFYYVANGLLF